MVVVVEPPSHDLLERKAETPRPLRLDVRDEGGNAEQDGRAGRKSEVCVVGKGPGSLKFLHSEAAVTQT